MLIRLGYDIQFDLPLDVPFVCLVNVHPSRVKNLREADELRVEPGVSVNDYIDSFGNRCTRFMAPKGPLRLYNSTLIEDSGLPDAMDLTAREVPVELLPEDTLRYLLGSRYCETDLLSDIAARLFGAVPRGFERVQAVCDWVHNHITFGYDFARNTRTALEVYKEQVGVCRDYQHLAVAFCRCLNIPARYATGYLGDIGVPLSDTPMDFSAWFEAYLEDRWWPFDARNGVRRIGRVLMATGRDAADVAITTSFGTAFLKKFEVVTDEVKAGDQVAALSSSGSMSTPTSSL